MNYIKIFFSALWRLWFYIWMLVIILVLSPLLLLSVASPNTYPTFFKLARIWAILTFYGMGMRIKVDAKSKLEKGKSYMFIANHTSMMDIMVMLIMVKDNPFVFVGKAELAKLPLFGFFYKRTCILVDRKDSKSRFQVFESAQQRIKQGLSICIFPEGGVPDDRTIILDTFKDGAFRLAIEHQIPIAPLSFGKLRHYFPFVWGVGHPGVVPVRYFEEMKTEGLAMDAKKEVKEKAYELIYPSVEQWEREYATR